MNTKGVSMQHQAASPTSKESGFTLIELSIVLVIIGLIVGGVLVGQEMVRAAQIRSVISQLEKYNTAVNAFRNKYGGIPGDLSNATTFFSAPIANGDGNLVITNELNTINNDDADFTYPQAEITNFFAQLSAAGLIDGTFTATPSATPLGSGGNFPLTKLGRGGITPLALNGVNRYHIGVAASDYSGNSTPDSDPFVFSDNTLSPNEAYQIDVKMDDGVPNSGNVVGRDGATAALIAVAPATANATHCLSAAAVYNVAAANAVADSLLCQVQVRMN